MVVALAVAAVMVAVWEGREGSGVKKVDTLPNRKCS